MLNSKYYEAAHQGSLEAAFKLIYELDLDYSRFKNMTGYICPVQKTRGNQIPVALAYIIAEKSDLILNQHIFLLNNKTGNSMSERLRFNPDFTGYIPKGNYVLVDDVFTTGITLKALKLYIEDNGSTVNSIYTLGNSKQGLIFEPSRLDIKMLLAKFPNIEKYFDISKMTWAQVKFMQRFPTLNSYHAYVHKKQAEFIYS